MSTSPTATTHHRTCNLCEAMCGIAIETAGGKVTSIRGDKSDPFSRGYICPKASALADLHEDPDRLRYPVRRTAGGFVRIGWDEAFDEVATRLQATQAAHGRNAVGMYLGNPNVHNYGSMLFALPFAQALGTRNRFSATSVDQLPHQLGSLLHFGHQLLLPIPDIDRTDYFLIIGANPVVSNGSLMSAPGAPRRIQAIRARGGKVVVIDPRHTETAELADRHHFIRPGTDVFLLLGVLHTLFAEKLAEPGRLRAMTDGLDAVEREVARFPPERVAAVTGIDAEAIKTLAREFAAAKSAVAYGRLGACTQEFGAVTIWLVNVLNLVTGNLDRVGGAMFTRPAVDVVALTAKLGQQGHFDKGRSRVRNLPEFAGEYPASVMAEEMLTEGPGQIKAMLTVAGNPVLSTPNGHKLDRALAGLDFMASIDFYVNETTRHASIILPPTGSLEHENYDLVFHVLAVRNTAKFSPALFEPGPDTRHDWQIFLELTSRLGKPGPAAPIVAGAKRAVLRRLTPERLLNVALRTGPYGVSRGGLSLKKLKQEVHGVDLGALEPCLPERLYTADKRIKIAPALLVGDLGRVTKKLDEAEAGAQEGFDLQLIGRRQLRSNNSWMHNSHRLVKGRNRCTVLMHPDDAAGRQLTSHQRVRVSSRIGSVEIELEISPEIMPGVVSIPHGWGHDRPGVELGTAQKNPGASVNDLTDELAIDALSGNAALSGVPVRVEALAG
ncbi:MAG: molybdopterin oxidoreductase family protein [Byssovorax sp.]